MQIENDRSLVSSDDVLNPTSLTGLSQEQLDIAVVAKWTNIDKFTATFTINTGDNNSRFILFSGLL